MEERQGKRPRWKLFLAIVFIIWTVCFIVLAITQKEIAPLGLGIVFAIGAVLLLKKDSPEKLAQKIQKQDDKKRTAVIKGQQKIAAGKAKQQSLERLRRTIDCAKHQAGLPLAQDIPCSLVYRGDCIDIMGGGSKFRLSMDKVRNITTTTDVDIQKQYVSSVGGAAAGAALFGPLGAMVGGRVKEKTRRTVTNYLVITYLKDGQVDYISFEVVGKLEGALRFISEVKIEHAPQPETIML